MAIQLPEERLVEMVTTRMLNRSRMTKLSAWFSIVLMSSLVAFTIFRFSGVVSESIGDEFDISLRGSSPRELAEIEKIKQEYDLKKTDMQLQTEVKLAELEVHKLELKSKENQTIRVMYLITLSITRIGAVFVSLYMVQILLSVMRYCLRTADHIACTADAMRLGLGQTKTIEEYLAAMSTSHIDFGKTPNTPSSDIKELLEKVVSNLSSMSTSITKG
jgi:hypothetical protein